MFDTLDGDYRDLAEACGPRSWRTISGAGFAVLGFVTKWVREMHLVQRAETGLLN